MGALAGTGTLWTPPGAADDFPNQPARLAPAKAPGGGGDLNARCPADALESRLGQPLVLENL